MKLFSHAGNVSRLGVRGEQGRRWPAALMLMAPVAIWLALTAAAASAQEEKQAKDGKHTQQAGEQTQTKQPALAPHEGFFRGFVRRVTEGKCMAKALLLVRMQEQPTGGAVQTNRERFEIYNNTQQARISDRFVLTAAIRSPEAAKLPSVQQAAKAGDAVDWLQRRLHVRFLGAGEALGDIIEVSLSSDDPHEAVTLVNAVVDAYLKEVIEADQKVRRQKLDELNRAYTAKETEIRQKFTELRQLAEKLGTDDKDTLALKQKLALEELNTYRVELARVRFDVRRAQSELAARQAASKAIDTVDPKNADLETLVQNDPVGRQLLVELGWHNAREARGDDAGAKAEEADGREKEIEMLREQLKLRKAYLTEILKRKRRSKTLVETPEMNTAIAALRAEEKQLEAEVDARRKDAERFGNATVDTEMARKEIKTLQNVLAEIARERDRLTIELCAAPRVTLLQKAVLPEDGQTRPSEAPKPAETPRN